MRIQQEDFDKLKQLDRIEYRQKEDKIDNWNDNDIGTIMGILLLIGGGVALVLLPQLIMAEILLKADGLVEIVFNIFSAGISLLIVLTILGFAFDIGAALKRNKMRKELQEEYFDFKIEVKK